MHDSKAIVVAVYEKYVIKYDAILRFSVSEHEVCESLSTDADDKWKQLDADPRLSEVLAMTSLALIFSD
ncbi:unnamed protein product [Lampetra planeri]